MKTKTFALILVIIFSFAQIVNGLSAPTQSNETPSDGSQLSSDLTQLCIDLNDSDRDNMYWEILQGGNVLENGTPFSYPTNTYNFSGCGCRCNRTLNFSRSITINSTYIDATLTNFPVLVNLSNAIVSKADGGNSIRFYDDACNLLAHEIDFWDASSYALLWVNVTSISSSVDTTFYVYYNDSSAASVENPTGVWDSNFVMVHHMKDNTTSTISDSTLVHNGTKTAANQPIEATGKVGKCQNFDGNNDKVSVADNVALDGMDAITISAWIKPDFGGSDDWGRIVDKQYNSAFAFFVHSKTAYGAVPGDLGCGLVTTGTGGGASNFYTGVFDLTCTENVWSYATMVWSAASAKTDIYLNKTAGVQQSRDGDNIATNAEDLIIGNSPTVNRAFYGLIDEIRFSNVARSASWIKASYENVANYSTFLVTDSEVLNNCSHEARYESSPTTLRMTSETTFNCYEYENVSYVDALNVTTNSSVQDWSHHHFLFNITEDKYDVTNVAVNWHGYAGYYTGGAKPKWYWDATMYIKKGTWGSGVNSTPTPYTGTPSLEWFNYSIDDNGFIDGTGFIEVAVENSVAGQPSTVYTDYVEVIITYVTGGDPNGTYCTNNISFWNNATCEEWWTWSVFVDDGHHNSYTLDYTFQNSPCILSTYFYPVHDATDICPCCDAICFGVGNLYDRVNLTVYRNDSTNNTFYIVEEYFNITNGTYCFCIDGHIAGGRYYPMRYNETYYWYVNASKVGNASLYATSSVHKFTTAKNLDACPCGIDNIGSGEIITGYLAYSIIGLVGLFGLLGFFIQRRKRQNDY